MYTVTIEPKVRKKAKHLKGLEQMINSISIVDPEVVKQFINLLEKNQGESIIQSHPELELAISNLPYKYKEMALSDDNIGSDRCRYCINKSKQQAKLWLFCKCKSSKQEDRLKQKSEAKELTFKSVVPIPQPLKELQLGEEYKHKVIKKKKHRKTKSTKLGLNCDIKADLDTSGSKIFKCKVVSDW